jgi:hypothetical protein
MNDDNIVTFQPYDDIIARTTPEGWELNVDGHFVLLSTIISQLMALNTLLGASNAGIISDN